ncbi:FkbM family methyltransferase [uncultured Psychroserpens sp.]|uniref:FkbM family methyltransferase n=1 Tax=uncultured Psychroserpens sp. TaxID=255436 RepID=UPI0026382459|nr:FkbM family methyltransferase [uncultured Psychroserpens sp.]
MTFKASLQNKIIQSLPNNYGIENYDEYRFGTYDATLRTKEERVSEKIKKTLKKNVKKLIKHRSGFEHYVKKAEEMTAPYLREFESMWLHLNPTDKDVLISLLAYRVMGWRKVKLPRNNKSYWQAIETAKTLVNYDDVYDPNFMHFMLHKFNLRTIDYNIDLYFSESRVAVDFIIEQYAYKLKGETLIEAQEGDVVLDIGGCWGDTALYFSDKVGAKGKVFSFEFIPRNIELFNININFNPELKSTIELIEQPVSNLSGDMVYFKDHGPGSKVQFQPFEDQTGTTKTISIDDFVNSKSLDTVDFIKMDIEGAEPVALEGAIETIKRFRPKLAIAIYHSMNDFAKIPNWILDLDLDYEIHIGHYTIHAEETICFAKPKAR